MRKIAFLLLFLAVPVFAEQHPMLDATWGQPITINPLKPPNSVQMLQVLLEQGGAIRLRDTPCGDDGRPNDAKLDNRTLLHTLAMVLGDGLDNKRHRVNTVAQCKADKFEFPEGVKDIWMCSLRVTETTKKGSYIANSDLDFGITRDKWTIIPGAFMCM